MLGEGQRSHHSHHTGKTSIISAHHFVYVSIYTHIYIYIYIYGHSNSQDKMLQMTNKIMFVYVIFVSILTECERDVDKHTLYMCNLNRDQLQLTMKKTKIKKIWTASDFVVLTCVSGSGCQVGEEG